MASSFLVREMGLEPTRRNHTHLKRACLPFQHSRKCHSIICFWQGFVKAFFGFCDLDSSRNCQRFLSRQGLTGFAFADIMKPLLEG